MSDGNESVDYARINAAVEAHYGVLGLDAPTREVIMRDAGEDGLALIREVSSFANEPGHWVYAESHIEAYNEVQRLLGQKYPSLSPGAVMRIATSAAYGWK